MNRRAPMTMFTVESGLSTSANSRSANPASRSAEISGLSFSYQQLIKSRRIADIDHAEDRVIRTAQVQLTFSRGQIDDVQFPLSMKQGVTHIGVEVVLRVSIEIAEPPGEVVVACFIGQAGLTGKQAGEHRSYCVGVCQHPAQEVENENNVGLCFRVGPTGAGDGFTQKHPERFRQVEFRPLRTFVPPDAALLVEGQQAAQQIHMAARVFYPARQVGDGVVFAVTVVVKLAVGVVEQQAFGVGVQQFRILADHLVEGGRILEGEAAARQFFAPLAPHLTGRAQMAFIDQHQIVVAKVLHGYALDAFFLSQLIQVNDLNM